ncbi:MAG: Lrp/AsnC family transcriptional regulator [Planctomycetota bacterium]|jgi:DNA-binding Lrp family transcriptional regulator|nr:Lrp/AsnC family transcriptional regulator [Planctomycetota bacterium]
MDRIDYEICQELQKNARLSNKELAAIVGMAASSCHERVKKLVADGVFSGFHAAVNPKKLGVGLEAMVHVKLVKHARTEVDSFFEHISQLPESIAFYHITGEFDYLVHVAVRDAGHLRDLALDAFTTREEVSQIQTSLVFTSKTMEQRPCFLRFKG